MYWVLLFHVWFPVWCWRMERPPPQNSPTGTSSGDDIILKMFEDIYIYIDRYIYIYFFLVEIEHPQKSKNQSFGGNKQYK